MNKWNELLVALDKAYGHEGESSSTFKPIKRYFNQSTGEWTTVIEYKSKKQDEVIVKPEKTPIQQKRQGLLNSLLRQKNTQTKK